MRAAITGRGSWTGCAREAPDRELLLIPMPEPGQGRDVDDALIARDQGVDRAKRLGRVAEALERREQGSGEVGKPLVAAPEQAEQLGPRLAVEPGRECRGLIPEAGQRAEIGHARELLLEILLDVPDVLVGQARPVLAGGRAGSRQHGIDPLRGRQRLDLEVAVQKEGVADDLDDVGRRQEAQADRVAGRVRLRPDREAGHEAGQFLLADRVDVADEVLGLALEDAPQRPVAGGGQHRHEIGFAGLARAEHADAHRPLDRGFELPRRGREAAELAGQDRPLGADRGLVGLRLEPLDGAARVPGRLPADLGELGIVHHGVLPPAQRTARMPVSSQ